MDSNTTIVWDFNTPLTSIDRSTQKINKETQALNDTLDQMDTTLQNLGDTEKAILRRKFIVRQSYFRKQEKSQVNSLILQLKQLEKTKLKISRRNHKDQSRNKWRR